MTNPKKPVSFEVELTLEEQFAIQKCAVEAKKMSREQLEKTLIDLVTNMKLTEKVYQNMLKNAWGLE